MARVLIEDATHTYPGNTAPAVDRINVEIADGELLVLVGPSGCGKTTILRMLAGLERIDSGRIVIGERDVTNIAPKERDVAMVFQNYALYPQMSVAENMGFALRMARAPKAEIARRVQTAAKLLDLEPYLDRKPKALSGGQRQRVAMGRAIVREPQAFLMDEPLSNLDAQLRVEMRTQIANLQQRLAVTTVYVTHDQVEAMTMGDRVAVLKDGVVQQIDTPTRLYERPQNAFVARFMGSPAMNLLTLGLHQEGAWLGDMLVPIERDVLADAGRRGVGLVNIGIRPEDLRLNGQTGGLPLVVQVVEALGAESYVYGTLTLPGGQDHSLILRTDARSAPTRGSTVNVSLVSERVHVFDAQSGDRLGPAPAG